MNQGASQLTRWVGLGGIISIGGIIFHCGRASESIDILFGKVECIEGESKSIHSTIYDIHGKVSSTQERVHSIENELKHIRKEVSKR